MGTSCNIIKLASFSMPRVLSKEEQAQAQRRFMTLLVPEQTDNFGSSAYVRRAYSTDRSLEMALKMPLPHTSPAQQLINNEVLFEEYRTLAAVSNLRGFPQVFGYGKTVDGTPALLMEWVRGTSLLDARKVLCRGSQTCTAQTAAAIARAVLVTVISTQSLDAPFVHRDLSLRNIMIRTDRATVAEQVLASSFDICLIDMGSAKLVKQDPSFTVNAIRRGTPAYAAPEMLDVDNAHTTLRNDPSVDIYALGSILYDLYAGHAPFAHELSIGSDYARIKRTVPLRMLVARCPEDQGFVDAVNACLALEQKTRPKASELMELLTSSPGVLGEKPIDLPAFRRVAPSPLPCVERTPETVITVKSKTASADAASAQNPFPARSAESLRRARLSRNHQRVVSAAIIAIALLVAALAILVVQVALA